MAINDLSLRQLQYAVAVADTLGFHRAAERCHVSQPALSAQIAQLEDALGVRLFERDRRRVLLTPAGEELVARARRVLVEASDLAEAALRLRDPASGLLKIGVIPTIAAYLLPDLVPIVAEGFPRLRLTFHEAKTHELVKDIDEGRLDAGIVALESDLGDLSVAELMKDPFVAALPAGHALAKKKRVHAHNLEGEQVLLLDDGHCFRSQALSLCAKNGAREGEFRATSLATLAQMVSCGAGVTLLPALAVPVENRRGQLVVRPFAPPAPGRTIVLAFRPRSPRAGALRELAAAACRKLARAAAARSR